MDKIQLIEFFVKEFKELRAEMQIKAAIANEYDEEYENCTDIIQVFILKAKIEIAKQKYNQELEYIDGKCDAYVKMMNLLGISSNGVIEY
jgi:hypothetical protein